MANPTTNLGMTKPTVGGSTDTWGTTINENVVDIIDALFSVTGTDVSMSDITFASVALEETGAGTDTVKIQAPSAVTASYTLTMPVAVGSTNQVLSAADNAGTLAWTTPVTGDITGVTAGAGMTGGGTSGDVTLNVIGTADKITVSADALTIAATYVGQTSVTTLGTIATGVWNGTKVASAYLDDDTAHLSGTQTFTGAKTFSAALAASSTLAVTGTSTLTGAVTATGGVVGDLTGNITGTAPAGTLTGATLASGVTASSLTSLGTIGSLVATTADINGGTFDGVVGGTTPAAGSFTTLAASSTLAVTGASTLTGAVTVSHSPNQGAATPFSIVIPATSSACAVTTDDNNSLDFSIVNASGVSVVSVLGHQNTISLGGAVTAASTLAVTGAAALNGGITQTAASVTDVIALAVRNTTDASDAGVFIRLGNSTSAAFGQIAAFAPTHATKPSEFWINTNVSSAVVFGTNAAENMRIANGGAITMSSTLSVTGALSKGSGSFKIDHPLPAMRDTHHLVHSFIEGPRADLIYRGVAALSEGSASVDLDAAAQMSAGTWELLCRDPQVWLQNDSGWAQVRGSVAGSTLTIACEDVTSTDSVSWMVVAERCDEHIIETGWTDENGRVIVEPQKAVEAPAASVE